MKNFAKLMLAGMLGGLISFGAGQLAENEGTGVPNSGQMPVRQASLPYGSTMQEALLPDFTEAAARVTPSVVHIRSTVESAYAGNQQMPEIPDAFRWFFGPDFRGDGQAPRNFKPQPRVGSGSGVIISSDGYIVTNNHVVADATQVEVVLNDNRSYEASVIGTDEATDLAVIKIDAAQLPVIRLGNSDNVRVGEWVLAVGNPFNLESTVTAGIVSAKGRNINIIPGRMAIEAFIQTDAAVNPGNSGGALVNQHGALIGINTAIASPTGSYSGYSFAVPVDLMKKVVEDIKAYGAVQRAFLGVTISEINSQLARDKNLSVSQGVYVDSLSANGAARDAGIKPGDVILKVEDQDMTSVPQLQETIARHRPGDEVEIVLLRDGVQKTVTARLRNIEGREELVRVEKPEVLNLLGAEFQNLTKSEKKELGIENGVRVNKLYAGKLRAETQMRGGFIITKVNKDKVDSVEDLTAKLENADGGILIEGIYPGSKNPVYYGFGI
jgi:Do/DeqQ family serine protease